MKKRSGAPSASARFRCSRYPATMLALCARYQLRPVGLAPNSSQSRTARDDGSPATPPRRATVSQPSRSRRSLTARHHTLPGGDASSGLSTPRRDCQRMNDNAARRNGRCRGARPVGPRNTRAISARRAAGSSRTAATCAPARASAPAWSLSGGGFGTPVTERGHQRTDESDVAAQPRRGSLDAWRSTGRTISLDLAWAASSVVSSSSIGGASPRPLASAHIRGVPLGPPTARPMGSAARKRLTLISTRWAVPGSNRRPPASGQDLGSCASALGPSSSMLPDRYAWQSGQGRPASMQLRPMARRSFRVATLAVMALLAVAGSDARADEGAVPPDLGTPPAEQPALADTPATLPAAEPAGDAEVGDQGVAGGAPSQDASH